MDSETSFMVAWLCACSLDRHIRAPSLPAHVHSPCSNQTLVPPSVPPFPRHRWGATYLLTGACSRRTSSTVWRASTSERWGERGRGARASGSERWGERGGGRASGSERGGRLACRPSSTRLLGACAVQGDTDVAARGLRPQVTRLPPRLYCCGVGS